MEAKAVESAVSDMVLSLPSLRKTSPPLGLRSNEELAETGESSRLAVQTMTLSSEGPTSQTPTAKPVPCG